MPKAGHLSPAARTLKTIPHPTACALARAPSYERRRRESDPQKAGRNTLRVRAAAARATSARGLAGRRKDRLIRRWLKPAQSRPPLALPAKTRTNLGKPPMQSGSRAHHPTARPRPGGPPRGVPGPTATPPTRALTESCGVTSNPCLSSHCCDAGAHAVPRGRFMIAETPPDAIDVQTWSLRRCFRFST